jgi:hypothetical protein
VHGRKRPGPVEDPGEDARAGSQDVEDDEDRGGQGRIERRDEETKRLDPARGRADDDDVASARVALARVDLLTQSILLRF